MFGVAGGISGSGDAISNCYNTGNISASSTTASAAAGGIYGYGSAYISNCYNRGTVSGSSGASSVFVGGIGGYNTGSVIRNCYNIGNISSSLSNSRNSYLGGIRGFDYGGTTISNCYWNSESIQSQTVNGSTQYPKKGVGNGTDNTKSLTTSEMQNRSNYRSNYTGFDFDGTWGFVTGENGGYPVLRAFYPAVSSINLNESTLELAKGHFPEMYLGIVYTGLDIFPKVTSVTWSIINAVPANCLRIVDQTDVYAVIEGLEAGTAIVRAAVNDGGTVHTADCVVTVYIPVEEIEPLLDIPSLPLGETTTVTANIIPSNAKNKNVTWSSSNDSVSVEGSGANSLTGILKAEKVTGVTAKIKVTAEDETNGIIEKTFSVDVSPVAIEDITLSKTILTIENGKSEQLTASVLPINASQDVEWSVSNHALLNGDIAYDDIVEVNDGIVTAKSVGTAIIEVRAGTVTKTCQVTVIEPIVSISLNKDKSEITVGSTDKLEVVFTPADATYKSIEWSSSDEDVATVNEVGVVTVHKFSSDSVSITAKVTDYYGEIFAEPLSCEVTTTLQHFSVESVNLNKSVTTILQGRTEKLFPTIEPSNATNKDVTWTSSDMSVATVDGKGVVTAISAGTANITVTTEDGGYTATCIVNVSESLLRVEIDKSKLVYTDNVGAIPVSWNIKGSGTTNQTLEIRRNNESPTSFPYNETNYTIPISSLSTLKESYTVRITVKNEFGESASDNVIFEVYNYDALKSELNSQININNSTKIENKNSDEIFSMRSNLTLSQNIPSFNKFSWTGQDKLIWQTADENIADVYYLSSTGWLRATPETPISPDTLVRVVGYENGNTTITVTHEKSGMNTDISVSVEVLNNQLYLIRTTPMGLTQIAYKNGAGQEVKKQATTQGETTRGEIAIYEPSGIIGEIKFQSYDNGQVISRFNKCRNTDFWRVRYFIISGE